MKDYSKRIYLSVFWCVLGIALFILSLAYNLDSFWCGLGCAFVLVGALQKIKWMRYRNDNNNRKKFDTDVNDERVQFISNKAWAYAGYFSVLAGALGVIGFKIAGNPELSNFCGIAVGVLALFYWASWLILNRRY